MDRSKARPHQSLRTHNDVVASGTLAILKDVHPHYERLESFLGDRETQKRLEQLVQTIAYCHDFGKSSPVFQRKVNDEIIPTAEIPLSYHTHVGSLLGFLATRQLFSDIPEDVRFCLSGFAMLAILQHHSPQAINPLPTKDSAVSLIEMLREEVDNTSQILSLLRELFKEDPQLTDSVFPQSSFAILDSVNELLGLDHNGLLCLLDDIEDVLEVYRKNSSLDDYILYRFLYSILCDMDEYDAGFSLGDTGKHSVVRDLPRSTIKENVIDLYRTRQIQSGVWRSPTNEREERIKHLREDTYHLTNEALSSTSRILSLQAPTGSGKTLAMMSYAIRIREKIRRQESFTPRIIYALPFISIAEQVENLVRDIFDIDHEENDALLTVHHSLSEMKWRSEGEYYDPKSISVFVDRWRSDIIITTTVRLCETILGSSKRDSIRFNRLARSIILMDEVQSFPVKYWDIIAETIRALTRNLGCHVLLATATMPTILKPEEMLTTIVDGTGVNRYQVQYDSTRIPLEEFTQEVIEGLGENPASNVLVVLNTKAAAASVYSKIQSCLGPNDIIYFLSGWVAPVHRRQTIVSLRESLKSRKSRVILVCTQVIEAGVDVSFDIAFRDLAPLDSIIQVAGRCNRNWEHEQLGIVNVRCVFDPETNRGYAQSVYDEVDLEMTREVLQEQGGNSYSEEKLRERLSQYFVDIRERKVTNVALNHAEHLEWDDLGRKFRLIDRNESACQIFINCDNKSESILTEIDSKLIEKKLSIPSAFYRYSIDLSSRHYEDLRGKIESVCDHEGRLLFGIIYMNRDQDVYSPDTGLNVSQS